MKKWHENREMIMVRVSATRAWRPEPGCQLHDGIVVIVGLQDVKGQVKERREQGTDHLALTLELAGLQAAQSMCPKQLFDASALPARQATLLQKLKCPYNRNLARFSAKLLLGGVIAVCGEVFPLDFDGDAHPNRHK